ncbi:MAG: tryptophan-rich sensory protein [Chloroflexota bacterium]|nr:tryptophan-rich sensory protein [Chloroflexota bacterium]
MAGTTHTHTAGTAELPKLLASLLIPLIAGGAGTLATNKNLKTWYPTLEKPPFNPPNWIFGPVWTTLYLLMGLAQYQVAQQGGHSATAQRAQRIYGLQLGLNTLWSLLFFGRRSPAAALIEIAGLWVAVLLTILTFAQISRRAAALLVPYLLWVSFAGLLNEEIWRRNR